MRMVFFFDEKQRQETVISAIVPQVDLSSHFIYITIKISVVLCKCVNNIIQSLDLIHINNAVFILFNEFAEHEEFKLR
jgi:hypothetical protein